jgi:hypothetical protein
LAGFFFEAFLAFFFAFFLAGFLAFFFAAFFFAGFFAAFFFAAFFAGFLADFLAVDFFFVDFLAAFFFAAIWNLLMKVKQLRALPALQRSGLFRAYHRRPEPRHDGRISGNRTVRGDALSRATGTHRDS